MEDVKMKKKYMTPTMKVVELSQKHFLLAASKVDKMKIKTNKEEYNIYYGGVDEEGDDDPD